MYYYQKYIFEDVGKYRIMAEFLGRECIQSTWVEFEVVEGGKGREKFKESHDFINMVDAFRVDTWAEPFVTRIDEFEDYSREMAKLVIYNNSAGVIGGILKKRDKNQKTLANAANMLSLARKYDIGVELWEYMSDRVNHPEKINCPDGYHVYPVNEYYF